MRPHRSLSVPANRDELIARLGRLAPDTRRQWGTLTPNEMLCHLADSFEAVMGSRAASSNETLVSRTLVKWIALHTSLPWPQGVPTRPEVDPRRGGTRPEDFERDRDKVIACIGRFTAPGATYGRHPGFGAMTQKEWLLWGYGHVDHHLRQFGV